MSFPSQTQVILEVVFHGGRKCKVSRPLLAHQATERTRATAIVSRGACQMPGHGALS